ncbi:MAG: epoxide hydrolase family protein [Janthinobacterium lividum]
MSANPAAFSLHIPDAAIEELRQRLSMTRYADPLPGEPWAYGTDVRWLRELVEYWREHFDWRAQEARVNAFPQYKVSLHGVDLHYLHVQGNGPEPLPLLLSHGWPGSIYEFLEIIPRLTDPGRFGGDPKDAFTVVVPSLPGYGLSYRAGQASLSIPQITDCFAELMTDVLGYARFGAQGGDWGAFITSRLGLAYADRMLGIHLNLMPLPRDPNAHASTPQEQAYLLEVGNWVKEGTGYSAIQGTRPQTLAASLADSPAGLAAWISDKFRSWSDCGGDIASAISIDALLANISLYWFTGSIGASFWPYYARAHDAPIIPDGAVITVPTGYAAFPAEFLLPPRSLAEKVYPNIHRWTEMPHGGHFAAMEQPQALAAEIAQFFRPLRER